MSKVVFGDETMEISSDCLGQITVRQRGNSSVAVRVVVYPDGILVEPNDVSTSEMVGHMPGMMIRNKK